MQFHEVMKVLEEGSPLVMAEDWDNVGLIAGRRDREVEMVYIAVDATDEVIADAVEQKADLLLTHHPLIFRAIKRVNTDDFIGRRLVTLIQHDITYVAMHTNFDVCGMADAAATRLGMKDTQVLDITFEEDGRVEGIGRIGTFDTEMTARECALKVKEAYGLSAIRLFGPPEKKIVRAALCPGSGKSVIDTGIAQGADVLITGDIDHHEGIDAVAQGMNIIDAGHYGIEKIFTDYMEAFLKERLPALKVIVAAECDPFITL